jgi:hypothetical protein
MSNWWFCCSFGAPDTITRKHKSAGLSAERLEPTWLFLNTRNTKLIEHSSLGRSRDGSPWGVFGPRSPGHRLSVADRPWFQAILAPLGSKMAQHGPKIPQNTPKMAQHKSQMALNRVAQDGSKMGLIWANKHWQTLNCPRKKQMFYNSPMLPKQPLRLRCFAPRKPKWPPRSAQDAPT